MLSLPEIEKAAAIVHGAMLPTPQHTWPLLAARTGCEVWVKHENHTPTGAFIKYLNFPLGLKNILDTASK